MESGKCTRSYYCFPLSVFHFPLILLALSQHIIGHQSQRSHLLADIEHGNVAHAYLFAGPPHVGKFAVARWFASRLLTEGQPPEVQEETLRQMHHLIHPDVLVLDRLWIEDVSDNWDEIAKSSNVPQMHRSKAPKIMRTDTISIDDIRALKDLLHETGDGQYRCCLIRSAERMRDEAANAFLKILEEPPEGRVFLLTTASPSLLLPTIVSRCRVIRFSNVAEEEMRNVVADLPEDDAHFILHVAQGAPGIALKLKNDPELLRAEKLLHAQALHFWTSSLLSERLKLLSPLLERGEEAERFLLHLALTLRERPHFSSEKERAFTQLISSLETNAYRPLLAERFVLRVSSPK